MSQSSQGTHIKIMGGLLILIVLACFYLIVTRSKSGIRITRIAAWLDGQPRLEQFEEFDKDKLQAEVGSMGTIDSACKNPTNPVDVCKNFETCCDATAELTSCICANPIVKSCRDNYKRCLNDQYLSSKSMAFIGLNNKAKACNTILDSCCKYMSTESEASNKGLVQVKGKNKDQDAKVLCSMADLAVCKNTCSMRKDCKSLILNTIDGRCELYDRPLIQKDPVYMASDSNFIQYEKSGKEGFQATVSQSAAKVCRDYKTLCSGDSAGGGCLCKNPVVLDCQRNYNKCMTGPDADEAICRGMFGACCGILDTMTSDPDFTKRFNMDDKPIKGRGLSNKLICQPMDVKTLDECKQRCRMNPDCNYIDSNLGLSLQEEPDTARYCKVYSGDPVPSNAPTMAPVNNLKTLYTKRIVDLDIS